MTSNGLLVMRAGVSKNPLNQVVSVLVAGNVYERKTGTAHAVIAHSIEISTKKFRASDLQAFLNYLGGILIHAVLCRVSDDMINCSTSIGRSAVLANVLDTPVTKLAMSNDVDVGKDFLDAGALNESKYILSQACGFNEEKTYFVIL